MEVKMKYIKEFIENIYGFVPTGEIIVCEDTSGDYDIGVVNVSVRGKKQDVITVAWSEYAEYLENKLSSL